MSVGLLLAGISLAAATEPEQLFLVSDSVAVGLHPSGTLGNPAQELGLLWDPQAASVPMGGDLLWVGDPFEVWTVEGTHGGAAFLFGGLGESDKVDRASIESLEMTWTDIHETPTLSIIEGTAQHQTMFIHTRLILSWNEPVLWIEMEMTALSDLGDVWFNRAFDPDPDYWADGSYGSDNEAGDGWVRGSSFLDGRTMVLAGPGQGGICDWCATSTEVLNGTPAGSGDEQLGLTMAVGDLSEGESTTLRLAYALSLEPEEAVTLATTAIDSDDLDGDGINQSDGDCDDTHAHVFPGATELADGLDNDCDGAIDEDDWAANDNETDGFDELPADAVWETDQESAGGVPASPQCSPK